MTKQLLDSKKGAWPEELPQTTPYYTTKNIVTGEIPFSLSYGTDAASQQKCVRQLIGLPTSRKTQMKNSLLGLQTSQRRKSWTQPLRLPPRDGARVLGGQVQTSSVDTGLVLDSFFIYNCDVVAKNLRILLVTSAILI